jgi:hypothetical protein
VSRQWQWQQAQHRAGRCIICRKRVVDGWRCAYHRKENRLRVEARDVARRQFGLCVRCGQEAAGWRYCQRCRALRADR